MSPEDRKYVRVYYNDLIRDYPDVWADDAQLATWLRLLATADPMWPTPPELPRSVKPRALAALVASSLVALTGHRFQMKGMDAERIRRSDAGRKGAAVRWQNEGNADRTANAMPKRAETSRDEQSKGATASVSTYETTDRPDLEAFLLVHRRVPTPRQRQVLDGVLQLHDETGGQWAADIILAHPDDPIGAVIEADKAWRHERIEEAKAAERKPTQIRRPRRPGLTGVTAELAELYRDIERKNGTPA